MEGWKDKGKQEYLLKKKRRLHDRKENSKEREE